VVIAAAIYVLDPGIASMVAFISTSLSWLGLA
jgi:hypothetical protein